MPSFLSAFPTRRRLWAGFFACTILCAALLAGFLLESRNGARERRQEADRRMQVLAARVHDTLIGAQVLVEQAAKAIESDTMPPGLDRWRLLAQGHFERYPHIYGVGIALSPAWLKAHPTAAFEANALGQASVVLVHEPGGEVAQRRIGYDYTDTTLATAAWYTQAARQGGAGVRWVGPYFGQAAQMNLVACSRRLLDRNGQLMGVIDAIYSMAALREGIANAAELGEGYTILLSADGTVLYHPRVDMLEGSRTMRQIGLQTNNPVLAEFSDSLEKRSALGEFRYTSIFTRESAHLRYRRIPGLGWYLLGVVPDKEHQFFHHYQKALFVVLMGGIGLLLWLWCLLAHGRPWWLSIGASVLFAFGTVTICWLSVMRYESGVSGNVSNMEAGKARDCGRTPLTNAFAASAYMDRCFELETARHSIPTGLVVQTINHTGAYSFALSGYLWQKYRSRADTALLGVEFPECEGTPVMVPAYSDSIAPGQFVRGWRFSLNLRVPFSYRRYPLDKEEFWLRMRPKGLSRTTVLEPDFLSYHQDSARTLGIDPNLVLPKWTILGTNFSYAVNRSTTDFGKAGFRARETAPELYFSIHARRNILDAFISHFIPLTVIMLMLFAILWVGRRQTGESKLLGFSALSGASGCSGLFFIAIYNHISVRNALGVSEVVYMECFFFVTYATILMVSFNAILVGTGSQSRFITHNDNQLSRLLYWPLVTGSILACTLVAFW